MSPQHRTDLEMECPRCWPRLAACSLLGLTVAAASFGLCAPAAPAPEKREAKEDADTRGRLPLLPDGILPPELEEVLKKLPALQGDPGGMLKQLQQFRSQLRESLAQARPDGPGRPGRGGRRSAPPRLGVLADIPSDALADQLNLPKDQGLVILEVLPDSPAAKAGLKPHDILLELNGKPVPSDVPRFHQDIANLKADTKVDVVVLRKGKKETISGLTLPEPRPVPERRRAPREGEPPGKGPRGRAPAGGTQTTLIRNNDQFTANERDGDRVITVIGKVTGGKATVTGIDIKDGADTKHFDSLDKVPAESRDRVKNLFETARKSLEGVDIDGK